MSEKEVDTICMSCIKNDYYLSKYELLIHEQLTQIKTCQSEVLIHKPFINPCENCITLPICKNSKNKYIVIDTCPLCRDALTTHIKDYSHRYCLVKFKLVMKYLEEI